MSEGIKAFLAVILWGLFLGLALRAWAVWNGYTVTSWWRSPWHNYKIGGKLWSQHQFGLAIDIVPVNSAVFAACRRLPVGYVINEGDHIHVQIV